MPCITHKFYYPFTGVALRALLNHMNKCGVFLVSHVSPNILRLIEKIAVKRGARYIVVYAVLTGALDYTPRQGLYINASHHEKYYMVDGIVLARGTANLTESEFDDRTLNDLTLYRCVKPGELEAVEDYRVMARMLITALRGAGLSTEEIVRFISGTPCARLFD